MCLVPMISHACNDVVSFHRYATNASEFTGLLASEHDLNPPVRYTRQHRIRLSW